jgi:hypothetical protein
MKVIFDDLDIEFLNAVQKDIFFDRSNINCLFDFNKCDIDILTDRLASLIGLDVLKGGR